MYLFIGLFAGAVILGMVVRRGTPQPQSIGLSTAPPPAQE
jgi:hypothetical protein